MGMLASRLIPVKHDQQSGPKQKQPPERARRMELLEATTRAKFKRWHTQTRNDRYSSRLEVPRALLRLVRHRKVKDQGVSW